jgi:hypothetical protein
MHEPDFSGPKGATVNQIFQVVANDVDLLQKQSHRIGQMLNIGNARV